MLKKLLKYEFKSQAKLLLPMILGILGSGILAALFLTLNNRLTYNNTAIAKVMQSTTTILSVLLIVAIFAATLVVLFLLIQRYYKNFFTDEGYLTFTLPVTTGQNILSKMIAAFVWSLAAGVACIIALFFLLFIGTAESGLFNVSLWQHMWVELSYLWEAAIQQVGSGQIALFGLELFLALLASFFGGLMIFYYAITQGCSSVRKNKILLSVLLFFAANIVVTLVRNILTIVAMIPWLSNLWFLEEETLLTPNTYTGFLHASMWISILVYAATAVVGFFLCRHILNKKLNLE